MAARAPHRPDRLAPEGQGEEAEDAMTTASRSGALACQPKALTVAATAVRGSRLSGPLALRQIPAWTV